MQWASGMIKFKSGNCLNVLEIVKKEPDTILFFIKDRRFVTIVIFIMACSFFTISYTWVFPGLNLIIPGAVPAKDRTFFVHALVKLFESRRTCHFKIKVLLCRCDLVAELLLLYLSQLEESFNNYKHTSNSNLGIIHKFI